MPTNRITNTADEVARNPLLGLAQSLGGGIEAMEARGQRELVASEVIPTKHLHGGSDELLTSMGFVLGPAVEGDRLFRHATLPAGWGVRPTDHSMWSRIVDERGRERLAIFYKAASYDRDAHISPNKRFSYTTDYPDDRTTPRTTWITDCGENTVRIGSCEPGEYDAQDRLYSEAKAWLAANRPDWGNPAAYWDE